MRGLRLFDYVVGALLVLSLTRPWWEPIIHPDLARSYLSDCGVIQSPWPIHTAPGGWMGVLQHRRL